MSHAGAQASTPLTWVEISKSALQHNIKAFQRLLRSSRSGLMTVVKSNAYGHGIAEVSNIVQRTGVRWFGVANIFEALHLRSAGVWSKILVLSYCEDELISDAIKKRISLPVFNIELAKKISQRATRLRQKALVHLKIDTGTTRLGFSQTDILAQWGRLVNLPGIVLEGAFTHFADAENLNQRMTDRQLHTFLSIVQRLKMEGVKPRILHAACSAATLLSPETRLDLSRIGISTYGLHSIEQGGRSLRTQYPWLSLRPVLSWRTRIIQLKSISRGTTVGYGRTFNARRKMKIATIPVGYWDGLDRGLSNRGSVIIRGIKSRITGRICMNLVMLDVTAVPGVRVGDRATIIGTQGKAHQSADDLAKLLGTINYEVVTRINPRIPRVITP